MPDPLDIEIKQETKLFDETRMKLGLNLADKLTPQKEVEVWQYMLEQYIRPQMNARRPYEKLWDLLYDAYRMRLKLSSMKFRPDEAKFVEVLKERMTAAGNRDMTLTDSLIFDTVDRLSNLTHYISWKDGKPAQFGSPEDRANPLQDMLYSPDYQKNKSQNAILAWSFSKEDAYVKSRMVNRDYFLYGFAYGVSDLYFKLSSNEKQQVFLKDIGISYEPMSVRKVFVDWRIPISNMNDQPCPFWFDMTPIFKVLSNQYEPTFNPMGFVNLDKVRTMCETPDSNNYFLGGESWFAAIKSRLESMEGGDVLADSAYTKIKASWTFLPMLPLDPKTGEFGYRVDDKGNKTKEPIPFRRFILQVWGSEIISNKVVMVRLQDIEDHYEGELPLYGATHLEDLNSAAYPMSICEALINSAIELTLNINYALDNNNLVNRPPSQHLVGGTSLNSDQINAPDGRFEVMQIGEMAWRQVPDATQTTMGINTGIRDRAQATGRVTESIMGKAAGGRTTAEEAGNLFETSMAQITTDINILNKAFHGDRGFGGRVFTAYAKWLDPDLIKKITGSYGWPVDAIDQKLRITLRTDVGTKYLTSVLKQHHLQYMLSAAAASPVLDQAILWQEYAAEVGMPGLGRAVIDGGRDREIGKATDQVFKTYLNELVIIDPMQDHKIAMNVKTRYIENTESEWNVKYGKLPYLMTGIPRVIALSEQVKIHYNYILQQQEMANRLAIEESRSAITDQMLQARASAPREPQQSNS